MLITSQFVRIYGRIARHNEGPFWGTIVIDLTTGLIVRVLRDGSPKYAQFVYSENVLIFPGFGDVHIHGRQDQTEKQNYKETYQTAADAALHGGVVHVSAMPNTPDPIVGGQQLAWHRNYVKTLNHVVCILNYVGIDKNTSPIGRCGEWPYKLFFGKSVGDLTIIYAGELETALSRYVGEYVSFHVEYEPIVLASAAGKTHSDRRPIECVTEGLRLLLPLILKYKIKAKLCHWSVGGESLRLIEEYRKLGAEILLEVSPLHLLFHTGMTEKNRALWLKVQMNPAIQGPEHCIELIERLRTGFVNILATDHAPHTEEEKYAAFAKFAERFPERKTNKEIAEALRAIDPALYEATCTENNISGAPWLDTFTAVCVHLMAVHGFTPQDIARVAAYNPGRFVNRYLSTQFPGRNFGRGFGEIKVGFMGSLTVIDMSKKMRVDRETLKTKVGWSPLEGMEFPGSLEAVFIAGVKQ